jgi:putative redox protein
LKKAIRNVIFMNAIIKQIQGLSFIGKSDTNHWIAIDGPMKFGGSEAATRPKELLLLSLGSCTGSDVASILNKKKIKLTNFEIKLDAEVAEEHPKVFTKIHIEFIFQGENLDPKQLERAIELSDSKYCPITSMLRPSVQITTSYKII